MSEISGWAVLEISNYYSDDKYYVAVDISEDDMKQVLAKKLSEHMRVVSSDLTQEEAFALRRLLLANDWG